MKVWLDLISISCNAACCGIVWCCSDAPSLRLALMLVLTAQCVNALGSYVEKKRQPKLDGIYIYGGLPTACGEHANASWQAGNWKITPEKDQ